MRKGLNVDSAIPQKILQPLRVKIIAPWAALAVLLTACGDKEPPMPQVDCETDAVKSELLADFAGKLKEEGAKGHTTASIRDLLVIDKVAPLEKNAKSGYSKCSAKIAVKYPSDFAAQIAKVFANENTYLTFKDELEDRYGVVNGAGMHAQLLDAVSDGPFGTVPASPDPAVIGKYQKTIQKNLEVVMQEQLDIPISYELSVGKDPNGKASNKIKWQINKRDALDIHVVLISIGSLK